MQNSGLDMGMGGPNVLRVSWESGRCLIRSIYRVINRSYQMPKNSPFQDGVSLAKMRKSCCLLSPSLPRFPQKGRNLWKIRLRLSH
jgi:hypothetical protein